MSPGTPRFSRRSLVAATAVGAASLASFTASPTGTPARAAQSTPKTGELLWKFQTGDWHRKHDPDAGKHPAILHRSGYVFAIEPESGNHAWRRRVGADANLHVVDDRVYVHDDDLVRLDAATGDEVWSVPAPYGATLSNGTFYIGHDIGEYAAIDMETGKERWRYSSGATVLDYTDPTVTDDMVFFSRTDGPSGSIYAVHPGTGVEQWRVESNHTLAVIDAVGDSLLVHGFDDEWYIAVLDSATGTSLWRLDFGSSPPSPVLVGDTIYVSTSVADEQRYLTALDARTGLERWRLATETQVWTTPILSDGVVYIGSGKGMVYALDAESGSVRWRFQTDGVIPSALVLADDVLYFGNAGYAFSFDARSGDERWRFNSDNNYSPAPVAANGAIFWMCGDGVIVMLDDNGDERWRFATEMALEAAPLVVDGMLYAGSGDGSLYAVDATTGDEAWRFATNGGVVSSPVLAENGTLYFGSRDRNLYALEATTGNERWRFAGDSGLSTSPVVDRDSVYFFGGGDDIHALNAETGAERWRFYAEGEVRLAPTVDGSSVYVTNFDGMLYRLSAETGSNSWFYVTDEFSSYPLAVGKDLVYFANDYVLFAISEGSGYDWWYLAPEFGIATAPVVVDHTVYVGVSWEGLYALDAETGGLRWFYDTSSGNAALMSPATVAEGTVFVGGIGTVYAIDQEWGFMRWEFPAYTVVSSPPVVFQGTVYVAGDDGTMFALDVATGAEHWRYSIGAPITSSPVIANDIVYVSSWDGAIYAFPTQSPPITAGIAAMVVVETPVRAEAATTSSVVTQLDAGTEVYVSGDPVVSDGITWWPVIAPDGSTGWVDGSALNGLP